MHIPLFFILLVVVVGVQAQTSNTSTSSSSSTSLTSSLTATATTSDFPPFPSLGGYSPCGKCASNEKTKFSERSRTVTECLALGSAAANCTSVVDVNCFCSKFASYPCSLSFTSILTLVL